MKLYSKPDFVIKDFNPDVIMTSDTLTPWNDDWNSGLSD